MSKLLGIPGEVNEDNYTLTKLDITVVAPDLDTAAYLLAKELKVKFGEFEMSDFSMSGRDTFWFVVEDKGGKIYKKLIGKEKVFDDGPKKKPLVLPNYIEVPEPEDVLEYAYGPDFDDSMWREHALQRQSQAKRISKAMDTQKTPRMAYS